MVMQRQQPIVVNAVIGDDHRLIIDLPDGPIGNVLVMVAPTETTEQAEASSTAPVNPERERLRTILLAAGKLGNAHMPPADMVFPTEEEILEAGIVPPGSPSTEEIINELRSGD